MKLKMHEISELPALLEKTKKQKMPFKTSYRIALLILEVKKHTDYYTQQVRQLLEWYGKKDESGNLVPTEDGQGVLLAEDTMTEAYSKLAELGELEIELPDTKLDLNDFEDIEMSPEEVMMLVPFIEA